MGTPQTTTNRPRPDARTPLEPLALASLLSALILGLCPLGALLAIVLGSIALRRLALAPGVRRGVGMAWLGIGLALAIPMLELLALERVQTYMLAAMDRTDTAAITATLTGQAPSKVWLTPAAGGAGPAELETFAAGLGTQLGTLREVRLTNRTREGVFDPVISVAFTAEFERGNAFGSADFEPVPSTEFPPELRLKSMVLDIAGTRTRIPAAEPATPETKPPNA